MEEDKGEASRKARDSVSNTFGSRTTLKKFLLVLRDEIDVFLNVGLWHFDGGPVRAPLFPYEMDRGAQLRRSY